MLHVQSHNFYHKLKGFVRKCPHLNQSLKSNYYHYYFKVLKIKFVVLPLGERTMVSLDVNRSVSDETHFYQLCVQAIASIKQLLISTL